LNPSTREGYCQQNISNPNR